MYAHLKGTVESMEDDGCVIDVQGVGYRVFISASTRQDMHVGQSLKLHIETIIRAESLHLFGFLNTIELAWFRLLTTVQGVGSRLALGILGSLSLKDLTRTIINQDKTMMTRADGVGPKLAGRILLELKDKNLPGADTPITMSNKRSTSEVKTLSSVYSDTLSALENLGYSKNEVKHTLDKILSEIDDDTSAPDLLRQALRALSPIKL